MELYKLNQIIMFLSECIVRKIRIVLGTKKRRESRKKSGTMCVLCIMYVYLYGLHIYDAVVRIIVARQIGGCSDGRMTAFSPTTCLTPQNNRTPKQSTTEWETLTVIVLLKYNSSSFTNNRVYLYIICCGAHPNSLFKPKIHDSDQGASLTERHRRSTIYNPAYYADDP